MKTLFDILGLKRPHGGANEHKVAEEILATLPGGLHVFRTLTGEPMAYSYVTDEESKTLFVAHLDTVHRDELAPNPVIYDAVKKVAYKMDGECLGADDGAGVWLLYEMAAAGVPGTYLWTVGEEKGGIGARWMAEEEEEFLGWFDRVIAFDRCGQSSVITHQGWGGRCCSDAFAEALSVQLNTVSAHGGLFFTPDPTGVYTDTAEFVTIIPECTNISVGYDREHSGSESLDVGFLEKLRDQCLLVDWENLPTVRDPADKDDRWGVLNSFGGGSRLVCNVSIEDLYTMTEQEVNDMCWDDPDVAATLLLELLGLEGGVEREFVDEHAAIDEQDFVLKSRRT